jgi:hypothetical protein
VQNGFRLLGEVSSRPPLLFRYWTETVGVGMPMSALVSNFFAATDLSKDANSFFKNSPRKTKFAESYEKRSVVRNL